MPTPLGLALSRHWAHTPDKESELLTNPRSSGRLGPNPLLCQKKKSSLLGHVGKMKSKPGPVFPTARAKRQPCVDAVPFSSAPRNRPAQLGLGTPHGIHFLSECQLAQERPAFSLVQGAHR